MKSAILYFIVILAAASVMAKPAMMREKRALKNFPGSVNGLDAFDQMIMASSGAQLAGSNHKLQNMNNGEEVVEHRSGRRRRNSGEYHESAKSAMKRTYDDPCEVVHGSENGYCKKLKCEIEKGVGHHECQGTTTTTTTPTTSPPPTTTTRIIVDTCEDIYGKGSEYCRRWNCEREKGVGHHECQGPTTPPPLTTTTRIIADTCEDIHGKGSEYCRRWNCEREKGVGHHECQGPTTPPPPTTTTRIIADTCEDIYGKGSEYCRRWNCEREKGVGHHECQGTTNTPTPTRKPQRSTTRRPTTTR